MTERTIYYTFISEGQIFATKELLPGLCLQSPAPPSTAETAGMEPKQGNADTPTAPILAAPQI